MKIRLAMLAMVVLALIAVPFVHADQGQKAEGEWRSLFNGKNLEGWERVNGTAEYRVENGMIIGTTSYGSPNSFLCTTEQFSDFVLVFDVKVDKGLNSGVQIRSATKGDDPHGRVYGPQVEIESSPGESGYIYGEATGLGWMSEDRSEHKYAYENGQWNQYRIKAVGDHIQTWVNGQLIADLTLTKRMKKHLPNNGQKGFICLQVHRIPRGVGPYSVRWRNIKIRVIE